MKRRAYPSNLTDAQWHLIEKLMPAGKKEGHPRVYEHRDVLNAIFYVLRTGCSWRMIPPDFPPLATVYAYFAAWQRSGLFERINTALRERVREQEGHHREPGAAIIDSQSIKTPEKGPRGYDGGKKVKGRKRHLLVYMLGFLLAAVVHPANQQDGRTCLQVLAQAKALGAPRLWLVWADRAYTGGIALCLRQASLSG